MLRLIFKLTKILLVGTLPFHILNESYVIRMKCPVLSYQIAFLYFEDSVLISYDVYMRSNSFTQGCYCSIVVLKLGELDA